MGFLEKIINVFKKPMVDDVIKLIQDLISFNITGTADIVSSSPESFSSSVFNLARSVNENFIIPVAAIIITYIAIQEIISMVVDKNNMHDVDTFMFFKWIVKTYISIFLVTHAFDFVMGIFSIMQNVIAQVSGGYSETVNVAVNLELIRDELIEHASIITVALLQLQLVVQSMATKVVQLIIWIIVVGRIVEMYFMISISSLPFATLTSHRFSNVGDTYIKNSVALGLQGLFILLAMAFFTTYYQSTQIEIFTDPSNINYFDGFKVLAAEILLLVTIFKSGRMAKSIIGA